MKAPQNFATRLLAWFRAHGRHDLPWQHPITPYRVWVSEIMLQQTQVQTVIPYFLRFMDRFPDLATLAQSPVDDVLAHWSGLGYYARGRNLHKTACIVQSAHQGTLPTTLEGLTALPGIGRSTAGAILSIGSGLPHPILDGNVKRVLTRLCGITPWPGEKKTEQQLWRLSESLTPQTQAADYTQAIMDLGATLCTRTKPRCEDCPFQQDCVAAATGQQRVIPGKKPKKAKPTREVWQLIIRDEAGRVCLSKRPDKGIWGGLWCLPECPKICDAKDWARETLQLRLSQSEALPPFRHSFTHYHLAIHPLTFTISPQTAATQTTDWFTLAEAAELGLSAPTRKLLTELEDQKDDAQSTVCEITT